MADKSEVVGRSLEELWLASLQTLTAYLAHDLKGALNGVSVNLEVVRGRAERPNTPIADVAKFAVAAADQLVVVVRITLALLSLGRTGRGPAEVSTIAKQVVNVIEDTLRSDGARMEIQIEGGLSAPTAAPTAAVRLALAEALLAAAGQKHDVSVRIRALPTPRADIQAATGVVLSDEIRTALGSAGITPTTDGHGISIVFPGPR